jgi:hypothetical protein
VLLMGTQKVLRGRQSDLCFAGQSAARVGLACCLKPGISRFQPRSTRFSLRLRGGSRLATQLSQKDRDHVLGEARFLDQQTDRDRPPLRFDTVAGVQEGRLVLRRKLR